MPEPSSNLQPPGQPTEDPPDGEFDPGGAALLRGLARFLLAAPQAMVRALRAAPRATAAVFSRLVRLLRTPEQEWEAISQEEKSSRSVFFALILPFLAIGALVEVIQYVPYWYFGRIPDVRSILLSAAMSLLGSLISAWISVALFYLMAPWFESVRRFSQTAKLYAYAMIPLWLFPVFELIPGIYRGIKYADYRYGPDPAFQFTMYAVVILTGLFWIYAYYQIWRGVPIMLETPKRKAIWFTLAHVGLKLGITVAWFYGFAVFRRLMWYLN